MDGSTPPMSLFSIAYAMVWAPSPTLDHGPHTGRLEILLGDRDGCLR